MQITIATSLTLRVGSMAEQTFNAVERVDEYCHLPEEAAYETLKNSNNTSARESGPAAKRSGGGSGSAGGTGSAAGGGAGARSKQRGKAGTAAGSLREPLLPVTAAPDSAAGSSSSAGTRGAGGSVSGGQGGGAVVAMNGAVPEGWPREGSIEFTDVKMRWVVSVGQLLACSVTLSTKLGAVSHILAASALAWFFCTCSMVVTW